METESWWRGHPGGDDGDGPQEQAAPQVRERQGVRRLLVHAIVLETLLGGDCAADTPRGPTYTRNR